MQASRTIRTKVRGTTFRDVDFDAIRRGDTLELYREYDNPHDPNAVRVTHCGSMIGYIGRDLATSLAPAMDGGANVTAEVEEVTGGTTEAPNRGINCLVTVTETIDERAFAAPGRVARGH